MKRRVKKKTWSNREKEQQQDRTMQNISLLSSLQKDLNPNSILPHVIHFPTSFTFQGTTRGISPLLEVCVERLCTGEREGIDSSQEG